MALLTSEKERNELRKYLDVAGAIFILIDSHQKVSLINKRGCEVLGYRQDEIIGRNWFETFIPERNRDQVRGVFEKLLSGEVEPAEYFENPLLTKSGEERVTLSAGQIAPHTHPASATTTLRATIDAANSKSPQGNIPATTIRRSIYNDGAPDVDMDSAAATTSVTVNANTGGQSHDNMQPWLAVRFCICEIGLYPSRS